MSGSSFREEKEGWPRGEIRFRAAELVSFWVYFRGPNKIINPGHQFFSAAAVERALSQGINISNSSHLSLKKLSLREKEF